MTVGAPTRRGRAAATGKRALLLLLTLVLSVTGLVALERPTPAYALSGSDFDPGYIISDELFYDGAAMSASQIQAFLDERIGTCQNGRCLNVSNITSPSYSSWTSPSTGELACAAVAGGTMRVAEWIYRVQTACGISARVILVTLQKEQGLIEGSRAQAPGDWALMHAMGMACPDTAPCDSAFAGLATQIYTGTEQLKIYKAARFGRQPGLQYIQWSPDADCGGSYVDVKNFATAALYNYTPYQPNAAALANLNGTGDYCSAYGNRNFWVYYNAWFGFPGGTPSSFTNDSAYLLARTATGDLLLYNATGTGAWNRPVTIGWGWEGMRLLAVGGDFTGDRLRDILAVSTAGDLYLYRTDGYVTITGSSVVSSGWGGIVALIAPGDVSGDGRQDLLTIDDSGVMQLHPGDGAGGFGAARVVSSGWDQMTKVLGVGDFSGDGNPDLVSVDRSGVLRLHAGDGLGAFGAGVQIGSGWEGMVSVLGIRDFDSDGRMDVLAIDRSGGLWFYSGNGAGGWRASGKKVGSGWEGMAAVVAAGAPGSQVHTRTAQPAGFGDLNGDRTRDLLGLTDSGTLYAFRGRGDGGFYGSFVMPGDWVTTRFLGAVGDFYGDGVSRVISVDDDGLMWLHSRSFAQGFTDATHINSGWETMSVILAPGDFDGDGIADLMAVDGNGDLWLYRGPTLARSQIGSGWGAFTSILAPGDVDGDGHADLVAATVAGELLLYRGDGSGGWSERRTIGSGWQIFDLLMSPGDFDGDRLPDILARKPNGDLWLYPTNGKGGWKPWREVGWGWGSMVWMG